MKPLERKLNDYITLKLIGDDTNIYVNGESFMLCKRLILNIPIEKTQEIEELDSIDEAAERLGWDGDQQVLNTKIDYQISPEVEFWGHCSNFQVWIENGYDTRLMHSNISFRLLRKLTEVGDPIAKEVFRKEISKRLNSGYDPVIYYLIKEKYAKHLSKEELLFSILEPDEAEVIMELERQLEIDFLINDNYENLETEPLISFTNRHVTRLQLVGLNLKEFPDCIKNLTHLKYLYVNGNEFETFPSWLKDLKFLEVLDLASCELETFPEILGKISSLKELNLFNNYITKLPYAISHLKKLEKLYLSYNDSIIESIPQDIKKELEKKIKLL